KTTDHGRDQPMTPPDARMEDTAADATLDDAIADESALVRDREKLRTVYAMPGTGAVRKQLDRLDAHCRAFIAISPFVMVATSGGDGKMDCSPRGDAPGFVLVHGERTLLIPDRPGNNRLDSLQNVIDDPRIG